jgi:PadR family transcriptional regulator PadR
MPAIGGDIVKGNTLTLILSLLKEGPTYGFEIAREIERRSEGTLRFREGLLYPALHQLEREGLVESEWRVSSQGPRRKYYRLTAKGKREAERLRSRWAVFSSAVDKVLKG